MYVIKCYINKVMRNDRKTKMKLEKWILFDSVPIRMFKLQYIPRNMHTVFALLCFVVVIHWLIFPYPSGLLHWHCGNLTIVPVPAKQPWWIWINTSCEFIMNDCITTTKQSTTKPCAYFLGYTVGSQTWSQLLSLELARNIFDILNHHADLGSQSRNDMMYMKWSYFPPYPSNLRDFDSTRTLTLCQCDLEIWLQISVR